ncbi:MAG: PIN domain-containing protein [Acidimicrobiia bacterium]
MAEGPYLVDTSVLGRAHQQDVGDRLEQLVRRGHMWTCRLIDLEVAYGARARDVSVIIEERFALPAVPMGQAVMDRALRVSGLLAQAGHHRGAKPVDLLIAATAEAAGLAVLHYDADYDRIAGVTNQPTEWIAPAGTLDH